MSLCLPNQGGLRRLCLAGWIFVLGGQISVRSAQISVRELFMAKLDHFNRTGKIDFYMGPSVKFVLTITDAFPNQKNWVQFVSSEGALYVIMPYDYPAAQPLFEHTPVLNNNF